jgi:peptide/nickel transport system substrate-binding protein
MRHIIFVALSLMLLASAAVAKTIRIGVSTWPPAMGNPYGQQVQGAVHPFPGIFEALTFMDMQGGTQPGLALSWTSDRANTWTFTLRPGVRFVNGEPFNAASVVAMIEWLKSPDAQRYFYAAEVKNIESATASDDLTVVFKTHQPDVILPKRLSLLPVVPPKLWQEAGVEGFSQRPRSSGAFTIESWGRDKGLYAMEAQSGAWRPSKNLSRIEFRVLPDQAARVQALRSGQIDIAYVIGFEDIDDLKTQGFNIVINPIATSSAIALPNINKDSPLADQRVRQAMNYAIERATIAQYILRGTVKPSANGIEQGVFGYDPEVRPYPYDPDKARALLAEAGYADGFSIKASVLTVGMPDGGAVFQKVAQDLAQVGIRLELNSVLGTDWVQMWSSGDWRGADVISSNWNGATYMDAGRAVESYTCMRVQPFFCAPEVESIFARSNVEFDDARRENLLRQALALLHDLAPTIYLFPQTEIMAVSPKVKNIVFRGRFLDWTEVDIEGPSP